MSEGFACSVPHSLRIKASSLGHPVLPQVHMTPLVIAPSLTTPTQYCNMRFEQSDSQASPKLRLFPGGYFVTISLIQPSIRCRVVRQNLSCLNLAQNLSLLPSILTHQ